MAFSPGDRLGSYEILGRIGSGGMGEVYRAHDPKLKRDVAIKLLSGRGASDPDRLRRFEQEARAASALDHPNIVTIHEIGETDDGQPFLVMQLVTGKSLRELLATRRPSVTETLKIASQIADGLARAHRSGIVHRDLKPDNVMVNADGLVKILDFGLAKLAEPEAGSELGTLDKERPQTREGHIVGTAHYMSPEQAKGESVDARSDLFALGAVLYEMVTGRKAFRGDSTVTVLAEIVGRDPERLNVLDPSLPVDLDKIVRRALRKDPERRFQSAADMKVALDELSEELESGDALIASDVQALGRKPRRLWPISAALGVSALVATLVVLTRPDRPELPPMRIVPMTSEPGHEDEPALSPDGEQLAYVKDRHIYVKLVGESEAVPLTSGDVWDASPAWSPDGSRVAFLRHAETNVEHHVLEVPAVGGTPRVLGRADGGHGISYAPDGSEIVVPHTETRFGNASLYLLSRETGEQRRLTSLGDDPDWKTEDRFPKFSPDGRHIAFMRVEGSTVGAGDVMLYEVATGEARVLVSEPGWLRWLDFTPDGRHVVYSVGQSNIAFQLEAVSIEGGTPRPLLPGERAMMPSMARTANRLAYVRLLDDPNVWRVSGPAAAEKSPPTRIIASTAGDGQAVLSPDGRSIAFSSDRTGNMEIWTANADGSSPKKLTSLGNAGDPRWSPDGSRIAFVSAIDGRWDVFVIDTDGGFARNLTSALFRDLFPSWSPDGRYIYYESTRDAGPLEDGREIWRVPVDGGEPERVMDDAYYPKMSADGTLYFFHDDAIARLREGETDPTPVLPHRFGFEWVPWRESIVRLRVGRNIDGPPSIQIIAFGTEETTTLLELEKGKEPAWITMSPDGQWIFYTQLDTAGSDIMLVENFLP